MPIGFIFWLVFFLVLFFCFYWGFRTREGGFNAFAPIGTTFVIFLLLFLLGWKTFGFIISG